MGTIQQLTTLLIENGRPADAIKLLDIELAKGETSDLWSNWASAHGNSGDLIQAERGYRRALELNPANPHAAANLAAILWTQVRRENFVPLTRGSARDLAKDLTARHVALLAGNGWGKEAQKIIVFIRENGLIDEAVAQELANTIVATRREVPLGNHQLFGVLEDSVVSSLQFSALSNLEEMKESFRQAVRWIEVETSSQCNRRCTYCPNHEFDRHSQNAFLDEKLYLKLLSDLREINYDGWIKLVGNNEFFLHEQNLGYLAAARKLLPAARLQIFSNADVLTRQQLDQVADHRLDALMITLHKAADRPYAEVDTLERAFILAQKLGIPLMLRCFERNTRIAFTTVYRGISITVHNVNFDAVGHDWAAFFAERRHAARVTPCSYPIRQLIFNYEGNSFMCCRAYKGVAPQIIEAGALTGNLADYPSLFHLYANPAHLRWRRALFTSALKTGPCRECDGDEAELLAAAEEFVKSRALWESKAETI